jgi:sulfur-carrier protein adenylyltransferase/sulfurtransferase
MSRDLVAEAKREIKEVDAEGLAKALKEDKDLFLLDVREREEFAEGYIEGAACIPRGFLELRIKGAVADPATPVAIYCAGGNRSALAAKTLKEMGYEKVVSLAGGISGWKRAGKPVVVPKNLTQEQRSRYGRHLLLPEVGEKGQAKLLDAKVLLLGAGGLGSPTALYLAAAGVGTLGIVDDDVVDASNLQRQILHATDRVGKPKVDSAEETIRKLNPDVKVVKFQTRLTSENVLTIFEGFDMVIDGTDNFPTRYLVNDACVVTKKANIHGSIFRFDGQVTVFDPARGGPCYRCLYPEPPPPELAPSCAEGGVLGVLPGTIGVLQATEAVKLILGVGDPLIGRLMMYDALEQRFRELKINRRKDCALCGEGAKFEGFIDYEEFCTVRGAA